MTRPRLQLGAVLALFLLFMPGWVAAQPIERVPMTFERAAGPDSCEDCHVIHARGQIRLDTPDHFKRFLEEQQITNDDAVLIVLNSPGGSLLGGLRFGRAIRAAGFSTHVGSVGSTTVDGAPARRTICASACSYAFLGGLTRSIAADGLYGVHQLSVGAEGAVPLKQAVALTQDLIAKISIYVEEMGAAQDIATLATRTAGRSMQWFDRESLQRLQVVNTTEPPSRERFKPIEMEDLVGDSDTSLS